MKTPHPIKKYSRWYRKWKPWLQWGVGGFLILSFFIYLIDSVAGFIASWFFLSAGLLVFPPSAKRIYPWIQKKFSFDVPRWGKYIAVIGLFILGSSIAPTTDSTPATVNTTQVAESSKTIDSSQEKDEVSPALIAETEEESITTTAEPNFLEGMQEATVVSITDGDTLKVNINGTVETIRVVGIDTPETVDPRKPVQCFGKEATAKMRELVSGKTVYLEPDQTQGERDKYQRLLRFVFLEDGSDVGLTLIKEGYASEYTYESNPYKYQLAYRNAETEARNNNKGLWASDVCPTPSITPTAKPITIPTQAPVQSIVPSPAPVVPSNDGYACDGPDLDCGDFTSHAQAQSFFDGCGFNANYDPHRLDSVGIGDGVACESLP